MNPLNWLPRLTNWLHRLFWSCDYIQQLYAIDPERYLCPQVSSHLKEIIRDWSVPMLDETELLGRFLVPYRRDASGELARGEGPMISTVLFGDPERPENTEHRATFVALLITLIEEGEIR